MVHSILELYGPQITQVIINNIGGDASRSELVNFADPLRQMVSQQVTARKWLSDALSNRNFPSTKVGDAEKRMFLQQVLKRQEDQPGRQGLLDGLPWDELRVCIMNLQAAKQSLYPFRGHIREAHWPHHQVPWAQKICRDFVSHNRGTIIDTRCAFQKV
ncbi:MAG: hypothetical protein Q9186_000376 [Xanthomendoza sp. 1 TL-2023]